MAATNGREDRPVNEQLLREPYRFDFFQAVRLLERAASQRGKRPQAQRQPVGGNAPPGREVVRFRALPSLTFPAGPISRIDLPDGGDVDDSLTAAPEMLVAFMGLIGPSGVLPRHYTSLVIERCHVQHKDYALRDFLDLFNHRSISLFFRAWEKYRFYTGFERSRTSGKSRDEDLFTFCLYCLVGLGTGDLRKRLSVADEAMLFYGGHFAHSPRCAVSLEALIEDYFRLPVEIQQFCGQFLQLSADEQSSLPTPQWPEGLHLQLGEDVIVGEQVWDVQSKFRFRLGPLNYQQFLRFLPTGDKLRQLGDLARLYVGMEFDFDVQLVLLGAEVPECLLSGDDQEGFCLGWNTWVRSEVFDHDADDAVFVLP